MYSDALDANSKYNSMPNITNEASYYDTCGIGEPAKDIQTKWSIVLAMNSIYHMCSILLTLCLFATIIWAPIAFVGMIGHCIGCPAYLGIIIYTGVIIYSDTGKACSDSSLPISDNKTFADHWDMLNALFIS